MQLGPSTDGRSLVRIKEGESVIIEFLKPGDDTRHSVTSVEIGYLDGGFRIIQHLERDGRCAEGACFVAYEAPIYESIESLGIGELIDKLFEAKSKHRQ